MNALPAEFPISLRSRTIAWSLFAFAIAMALIQALGEPAFQILRFDRGAIHAGQYWRLITGHVVHLGWAHLSLNLAGLVLVYIFGGHRLSPMTWGLTGLLIALGIDAGLWLWKPELQWYVGLSGVLHGWFAVSAITLWRERGWRAGALLIALLAIKLAWELWHGALPGTSKLIGGDVIVEVHLFGSASGIAVAALMEIARRIAGLHRADATRRERIRRT